jgi:hypothetical protein
MPDPSNLSAESFGSPGLGSSYLQVVQPVLDLGTLVLVLLLASQPCAIFLDREEDAVTTNVHRSNGMSPEVKSAEGNHHE